MSKGPQLYGGELSRTPGGLWVPAASGRLSASDALTVFVPHKVVFPDLPDDFSEFKRLVASLSRTDTLFWCARLNILVSDSELDMLDVQSRCIRVFFTDEEITRINAFAFQRGGASRVQVFFRGQLLELLRWAALWANDLPDDGLTFDDPDVRRRFVRAALLASDIWGRRLYAESLDGDLPVDDLRQEMLPAIRRMSLENAPCPDPILHLARGAALFADNMRAKTPDMEPAFREATGLSIDDYFSMLTQIAADLFKVRTAKDLEALQDSSKGGLFSAAAYEGAAEPIGSIARTFFKHEAQTADELREALWDGRTDADEGSAGRFNLRALRERPIFRASNGRAIVLEPRYFVERGSAGPLFSLARAASGKPQRWFALFGDVFEEYSHAMLRRMYPDKDGLARRFFPKPGGVDEHGHAVILNDGLLLGIESAAIFEMKAAWTPDSVTDPEADGASYMSELRRRYGITDAPREGDRPVKGLGQLARTVSHVCASSWTVQEPTLTGIRTLFPVLLVHDPHVGSPIHSHILAREFARYLGVDQPAQAGWARIQRGAFAVSHVILITLDDLEMLERSTSYFSLLDCLESYDRACPDRMVSFHDYLARSEYRKWLRGNDWLASRCLEMLEACRERLFPTQPGESEATSS